MVQVVLPNDANPLGFILGGTVMHLIDIAGAIACHRHTRSLLVTAAVDGLQFLHPIKVGDLIILKAHVTCVFTTSLEVQVEVFSEETLTGARRLTSRAFLTFVAIAPGMAPGDSSAACRGHRGRAPGVRAGARAARRNGCGTKFKAESRRHSLPVGTRPAVRRVCCVLFRLVASNLQPRPKIRSRSGRGFGRAAL